RRVSPFLTLDPPDEKLRTSAESRFSASSKEIRVRVEFSKNKLAIVMSRNVGTFLIGRLITSLKLSAVCRIISISSFVMYLIPSRCGWLRLELIMEYPVLNHTIGPDSGCPAHPSL